MAPAQTERRIDHRVKEEDEDDKQLGVTCMKTLPDELEALEVQEQTGEQDYMEPPCPLTHPAVTCPEQQPEELEVKAGLVRKQEIQKHLQPEPVEEARQLALERGLGHLTAEQCSEANRQKKKGKPLFLS